MPAHLVATVTNFIRFYAPGIKARIEKALKQDGACLKVVLVAGIKLKKIFESVDEPNEPVLLDRALLQVKLKFIPLQILTT